MKRYIMRGMNVKNALVYAEDFDKALKAARRVNENYDGGHMENDNPAHNEKTELTIDENGNIIDENTVEEKNAPIKSAASSRYMGMAALVDTNDVVYLGKENNYNFGKNGYYGPAYYDNSDNSLIKISDNRDIYGFLYSAGCVLSLNDAIYKGIYTIERLERFAELQHGILSQFTELEPFTFDNVPFTGTALSAYKIKFMAA